jgi:hypothetical protein
MRPWRSLVENLHFVSQFSAKIAGVSFRLVSRQKSSPLESIRKECPFGLHLCHFWVDLPALTGEIGSKCWWSWFCLTVSMTLCYHLGWLHTNLSVSVIYHPHDVFLEIGGASGGGSRSWSSSEMISNAQITLNMMHTWINHKIYPA